MNLCVYIYFFSLISQFIVFWTEYIHRLIGCIASITRFEIYSEYRDRFGSFSTTRACKKKLIIFDLKLKSFYDAYIVNCVWPMEALDLYIHWFELNQRTMKFSHNRIQTNKHINPLSSSINMNVNFIYCFYKLSCSP